MEEVRGFNELRQDQFAVVRCVRGVVGFLAVLILKMNEAGILDAIALGGSDGKQHAFGQT